MNQQDTPTIVVPVSPAAEHTYLAALVAGVLDAELLTLDPPEFTVERNELVYAAAAKRLLGDHPLAPALLIEDLVSEGNLQLVGGAAFVEELARDGQTTSVAVADECAKTIREKSVARRLMENAPVLFAQNKGDQEKTFSKLAEFVDDMRLKMYGMDAPKFSDDTAIDELLGEIEWMWEKWIPRGFVTALVAEQETGKSNVALDLCGRLMTGAPWPDGTPTGIAPDCRLLWIDTEMGQGALTQRMNDWGLPRGRFIFPANPLQLLQFDKPEDWAWVEAAVRRFSPPLIVIDALSGAHQSEEKDNDAMKLLLLKISALAQKYKIGVLVIHHLRKAGIGEPDYPVTKARVRGASAITQYCRSIMALGVPDKSQPDLRRLDPIKSSYSLPPTPIGYRITDTGLAWGDAPEVPKSANPIQGSKAFLLDFLEGGRRYSDEVKEAAESEGLAMRTVERAAKELHVERKRERGKEGRWYWQLPGRQSAVDQFDETAKGLYDEG